MTNEPNTELMAWQLEQDKTYGNVMGGLATIDGVVTAGVGAATAGFAPKMVDAYKEILTEAIDSISDTGVMSGSTVSAQNGMESTYSWNIDTEAVTNTLQQALEHADGLEPILVTAGLVLAGLGVYSILDGVSRTKVTGKLEKASEMLRGKPTKGEMQQAAEYLDLGKWGTMNRAATYIDGTASAALGALGVATTPAGGIILLPFAAYGLYDAKSKRYDTQERANAIREELNAYSGKPTAAA
ncbi:MAG: hypothetical protein JW727_03425 [Candidatus Aenigmarchaeota archaeon]|nr:hypothetical protein [Candidatus Aenigmarchaeota archaeon]